MNSNRHYTNTFIKNICTNCYQHPFICILLPCFPYIFYQNCMTNYQLKIDDDGYDGDDGDDGDNDNYSENDSINNWIDIEN